MKKKLLSLALALCMLASTMPFAALAQEADAVLPAAEAVQSVQTDETADTAVPAVETPAEETPAASTPADETPAASTPAEETPTEQAPESEASSEEAPASSVAVTEIAVDVAQTPDDTDAQEIYAGEETAEISFGATITGVQPTKGSGTASSPYEIETAANLVWFAERVNKYGASPACATLMADIDVSSMDWSPIGQTYTYRGTFDGNGHTVKLNISISGLSIGAVGLFGVVEGGVDGAATVKNVMVTGSITSSTTAGAIVGFLRNGGRIENCASNCTITIAGNNGEAMAGGICGQNGYDSYLGGTITGCTNMGNVIAYERNVYVGGICGANCANGSITECISSGNVAGGYVPDVICGFDVEEYGSTVNGCYYVYDTDRNVSGATQNSDILDGSFCYSTLNKNNTTNPTWTQTLGTDTAPVKMSSHGTVYKVTAYQGCNIYSPKDTDAYSNTNGPKFGSHKNENGVCIYCRENYEAPTLSNGVYQIKNAGNLAWFANHVNSGEARKSANWDAVLLNNIDLSAVCGKTAGLNNTERSWTPIGNSKDVAYLGTLDGKGFTVSNLYIYTDAKESPYSGLVGRLYGETNTSSGGPWKNGIIKNLTVAGNVTVTGSVTGGSYAAGICAYNGKLTNATSPAIENCINNVNVTANYSQVSTGGVCGSSSAANISNCANNGTITNTSAKNIGGISGYAGNVTIKGCFNTGSVNGGAGNGIASAIATTTITNSYTLEDSGTETDTTRIKTAAQFKSGEVCYWLNDGQVSGTPAWRQNVDNGQTVDALPTLVSTHGVVYRNATNLCDGVKPGPSQYSNTERETQAGLHDYGSNGVCTVCKNSFEEPAKINNVYQIANAGNLKWFADYINETATHGDTDAVLTADIDLSPVCGLTSGVGGVKRNWTPIGKDFSYMYEGDFDGQGHTITNLYIDTTEDAPQGLFGYIGSDSSADGACGTVKNLNVQGSITAGTGASGSRSDHVGGICARIHSFATNPCVISNCKTDITINGYANIGGICGTNTAGKIINCVSTGSITASGTWVGGICGTNYSNSIIENCYNTGAVKAMGYVGGISNTNTGTITGCYNIGKVTNTDTKYNAYTFGISDSGTISNSYCLEGTAANAAATTATNVGVKTTTQFKSGEVCYLLNGGSTTSPTWHQTCGTGYPSLTGAEVVYRSENFGCDGNSKNPPEYLYANSQKSDTYEEHQYNNDGVCSVCHDYEQPTIDGSYKITNAGNLAWFANYINEGNTASAYLANDINLSAVCGEAAGKNWTPIGASGDTPFIGTFDGNGHTISGLYINTADTDKTLGLFGVIGNGSTSGTVTNLTVQGSISSTNTSIGTFARSDYIGGVSGRLNFGSISNCISDVTINGYANLGGICGVASLASSIINCVNNGKITAAGNYVGGITGSVKNSTITNCSNAGELSSNVGYIGGISGENLGTIKGCYNTGKVNCSTDYHVGGICGMNNMGFAIINSYCLEGTAESAVGWVDGTLTNVDIKTAEQFANGEVCYLLNAYTTDTGVKKWRQNIDNGQTADATPTLDQTHGTVYCYDTAYSNIVKSHITVTSALNAYDSTETVADVTITGDGYYKNGDNYTITATAKDGFTFNGWYNKANGVLAASSLEYTASAAQDISYAAVYTANAKAKLTVSGSNYTINDGSQQSQPTDADYTLGTKITLVANNTDNTFRYWKNASGKIVSTSAEYTFTFVSAASITLVRSETAENTAFVEFVSAYSQVLSGKAYTYKDGETQEEITYPAAPSKVGNTFKAWSLTQDEIYAKIKSGDKHVTVTPTYTQNAERYTVTTYQKLGDDDATTLSTYSDLMPGQILTVEADEQIARSDDDIWSFAGWYSKTEDTLLSTSTQYSIQVSKSMDLVAKYSKGKQEQKPIIAITNCYTSTVGTANKITFTATRNVPEGYTLVEQGMLYGTDSALDSTDNFVIGSGTAFNRYIATSTASDGIFNMHVNVGNKKDTIVYARAYMIVQNIATGNEEIIYSDISKRSFNG